ncbi:hypothetical protein Tco_0019061 [Tanacetum coccineum]
MALKSSRGIHLTWEDLTNRFLAQLFPLIRTAKLRRHLDVPTTQVKEDKGTESDMVINENIVEPIRLVDNKEAMDEEEATRWEKYADKLPKIPRSLPIGKYLS